MVLFKPIPGHLGDIGSNHDDWNHRTQPGGAVVGLIFTAAVGAICLILLGLTDDFLVDWLWFSSVVVTARLLLCREGPVLRSRPLSAALRQQRCGCRCKLYRHPRGAAHSVVADWAFD